MILEKEQLITVIKATRAIEAVLASQEEGDILQSHKGHALIDKAVSDFICDFESVMRKGQTMLGL